MLKKLLPVVLILLLLCGCGTRETVFQVDGRYGTYTVNTEACTITDGTYTYTYNASENNIRITYPNGAWYSCSTGGQISNIGWSDDYDSTPNSPYSDGDHLVDAVKKVTKTRKAEPGMVITALVLAVYGLFLLLAPEAAFHLRFGRWFKNAEPTEFAIKYTRIGGGIIMVLAIIFMLVW